MPEQNPSPAIGPEQFSDSPELEGAVVPPALEVGPGPSPVGVSPETRIAEARAALEDAAPKLSGLSTSETTARASVVESAPAPANYDPLDIALKPLADRLPDGVKPVIKLHRGGWNIRNPEGYQERLSNKLKGTWMAIAEEMGFDPNDFPIRKVDFWMPRGTNPANTTKTDEFKSWVHGRRNTPRAFDDPESLGKLEGRYSHPNFPSRARLNMPLPPHQNELGVDTLGHELIHAALDKQGIDIPLTRTAKYDDAKFFTEGLGRIGNLVMQEHLTNSVSPVTVEGAEAVANTIKEDIPLNGAGRFAYDEHNAWLHRYLVHEQGGLGKLKEISDSFKRPPSSSQLIEAYERTYGRSLAELMAEAARWSQGRSTSYQRRS